MFKTRNIAIMGIFLSLMVIGAYIQISLPTPFMVMHITMQLFVSIIIGLCLPLKLSSMTLMTYIFAGVMGLPIFATGGGLYYIAKPTFGFILGILLCGMMCSFLYHRCHPKTIKDYFMIGLAGMSLYYISGIVYYFVMTRFILLTNVPLEIIIFNCFIVSIVPDTLITFFACVSARRLENVRKSVIYE